MNDVDFIIIAQVVISIAFLTPVIIYALKHPRQFDRSQSQCLDDVRNRMMQDSLDRAANAAEKTARIADIERTDNTSRRWSNYK